MVNNSPSFFSSIPFSLFQVKVEKEQEQDLDSAPRVPPLCKASSTVFQHHTFRQLHFGEKSMSRSSQPLGLWSHLHRIQGCWLWRRLGKVFALQAQRAEFDHHNPCQKEGGQRDLWASLVSKPSQPMSSRPTDDETLSQNKVDSAQVRTSEVVLWPSPETLSVQPPVNTYTHKNIRLSKNEPATASGSNE